MTAFLMHMKSAGCRGGTFPYCSAVGWSVLHLFSSLWVIALCSSFGEPRISSPLVNQMPFPHLTKGWALDVIRANQTLFPEQDTSYGWLLLEETIHRFLPSASLELPRAQPYPFNSVMLAQGQFLPLESKEPQMIHLC